MSDLQTAEKPKAEAKKADAKEAEAPDHKVYAQTSQGLCNAHARAMGGLMTDAELLAQADNVARFLGIHRQADPKSRETALWSIRHKDLINSKQYKAAKP